MAGLLAALGGILVLFGALMAYVAISGGKPIAVWETAHTHYVFVPQPHLQSLPMGAASVIAGLLLAGLSLRLWSVRR